MTKMLRLNFTDLLAAVQVPRTKFSPIIENLNDYWKTRWFWIHPDIGQLIELL